MRKSDKSKTMGIGEEGIGKEPKWKTEALALIGRNYKPYPRQKEFRDCEAKYRLFGGAAGPGKTKALLWEAIYQAHAAEYVDTLLLRRTFPELEASLLAYFRRDVPRELYKKYNESKHIVTWNNGSTTRFGHCAHEFDVYQYQGAEYLFIGIDELTHFTLRQWQFLTSRNRCPVRGTSPNMAGATNPGNIGHAWVKAMWVDRVPPTGMESAEQYDPGDYAFIRATIADNPTYANDSNYLKTLETLPTHLRRAFLDGEWDIFAGQYFDRFNREQHTVRPEQIHIEAWWPRWISVDWGFEHPSAVLWHAAMPNGSVVTYREFVQNHLSPRMLATAIAERSRGERISAVYLSPDAFAQRTAEDTIAEQLGHGLQAEHLPRPDPADDDRIGGWMLMYEMLRSERWLITTNCLKLIETMPSLTRDERNIEDVLKFDGDDVADSARYGLKSRLAASDAPYGVRQLERITAVDPTSRAIWMRQVEADQQRKTGAIRLPRRWRV